MRSREGNVTQSCSDSEAGEEISQTRVELHSPGLWDGAGRDCRSLAAGSAPFIQSSFIRSSSTLFYSVEDIRKSLYCSEGEKSTLGPCLRWGWGLVCAARGAGARCPPSARAQPAFGALLWRGVVQGRLLAELDARWWLGSVERLLVSCVAGLLGQRRLTAPLASECAPVGFLSCGPALLVVVSGWRCIPGAIGLLSLRKSSLLPRRLGGRRQDLALALFC